MSTRQFPLAASVCSAPLWSCALIPIACLLLLWLPRLQGRQSTPADQSGIQVQQSDVPLQVRVTGRNFVWRFTLPGPDHLLATPDDVPHVGTLLIAPRSRIEFQVTSEDYVYVFEIPGHCRDIAVPGLIRTIRFTAPDSGTIALPADPMCAFQPLHEDVMGRLIVSSESIAP